MNSLPMNLQDLLAAEAESLDFLLFWGHTPKRADAVDKSCFSQWFPASFAQDGVCYPTAEHWMMAGKARLFHDNEALAKILSAPHPQQAKTFGRTVRGLDEAQWNARKYDLVVEGNLLKFSQHEPLRRYLLSTRDSILVEASPHDRVWGIGLAQDDPRAKQPTEWRGENLLGFALMEVRARLRTGNA